MRPTEVSRLAALTLMVMCTALMIASPRERSEQYCPANDSGIAVHAEIRDISRVSENADVLILRAHFVLRIVNSTGEPVIVLAEKPQVGDFWLARSETDAESCRYIYEHSEWPSVDRSLRWEQLHRDLDQKDPPEALTRVIKPGDAWEFEQQETFAIAKRASLDNKSMSLDDIRKQPALWAKIRLLMWPNNLEANMLNPKFGFRLQRRWKTKGRLVIDNLTSEPTPFAIPKE